MTRRASRTASVVALGRALADAGHTTVAAGLHDPLAAALVDGPWAALRPAAGLGLRLVPAFARPASLAWIDALVLRVCAIDAAIADAVAAGCEQLVILGAGLDARAWRLPLDAVDVFEVDHAGTQAHKRARVAGRRPSARSVTFVEVDFERDALGERLAAAGHRPERRTVWVWEGVTMYLTDAALTGTLAALRAASAPGSVALVHYHEPGHHSRLMEGVVARWSEPFVGLRTRGAMRAAVEAVGLVVEEDSGTTEWRARFGGRGWDSEVARAQRMVRARAP